ncbi:MAG TPA: sulfatase-like hydrolase/transferase, partial [Planctomycetota bacterium]|nr:sulfatase-like hydrolase/transferase [Planctomycetota bacterium]
LALVAEALLLALALRSTRCAAACARLFPRGVRIALACGLVALSAFERVSYGIADAANFRQVVTAAATFPFYQPLRMHKIAKALGFAAERDSSLRMKVDEVNLRYPLAPLARAPGSRDWNIVWLVSESLRADMLDPEIMPATSAFAERALDFRHHYSGGNGTRMGMFAMFYGLYGSYWFPFLSETRGPVFFDVLLDAGYDCQAFTSAKFSFPEFNETIFARFPRERLHEGDDALAGWENDRSNVSALLAGIDARPADRPFFRFMFFESPHARYYFPPESVIRTPYLADLNYATMDLSRDIGLIKNRYVNACHHLDSQLQRVLDGLSERGLLDSTLVVITGDHGEEFMEHGRWGHHAGFSEQQTRTPLVLWVPGTAPARVSALSSHLDIVPTLLARLGVTNPPSDFSLGHDLLGSELRTDTVIADWDNLACVDADGKGVFPVNHGGFAGVQVTTVDDAPVADPDAWIAAHRERLQRVMKELSRFSK